MSTTMRWRVGCKCETKDIRSLVGDWEQKSDVKVSKEPCVDCGEHKTAMWVRVAK